MFGFRKKKSASEETQIPYQVYESVYEPENKRRKLILRLLIALAVVTLLVIGLLVARRLMGDGSNGSGEAAGSPNTQLQQAPQTNSPMPGGMGEPARPQINGGVNNSTVDQPQ